MKWYYKKTIKTKDINLLTDIYNDKYGNYDYSDDSRHLDFKFEDKLIESVGDLSNLNILVCGSNSGYEIGILLEYYPSANFTALDISSDALNKLKKHLPQVKCIHGNMEKISILDKSYDVYINCRAIHSTNVDIQKSLEEAVRITKGRIVISIANGYLVDGKIVNGMFDYNTNLIDKNKSFLVKETVKNLLSGNNYKIEESSSIAELFIIAERSFLRSEK